MSARREAVRRPLSGCRSPPCQRWGKLWAGQPLWIKRTGIRKIKGDDGGCFATALPRCASMAASWSIRGARTHGRTSG
jgi:hypothetical protein